MIPGRAIQDRILIVLLASYAFAILLLVSISARLWWQSSMNLISYEFDYFLGLFAGSKDAQQWIERGRMLHFAGCLGVGLLYLGLVGRLMRDPQALTNSFLVRYAALVSILFALGMPWLSPDVFFYIGKGWAESHYGASPYLVPISSLPGYEADQMFANIFPGFLHTATGYGPFFQKVAELIAALSGGNEKLALGLHKVVNLLLHGACSCLVYRLAPPSMARVAALSYAVNPLICFSVLTCVHNDHWGNMFVLLALLALTKRRWAWTGVALGAAFGIKYFPLVYVPIIGLAALMQRGGQGALVSRLADAVKFSLGFALTAIASFLLFYPEAIQDFAATLGSGGASLYRNSVYHLVNMILVFVLPEVAGTRAFSLSYEFMREMGGSLRAVYIGIYAVALLLSLQRLRRDVFNGSVEACLLVTILYFIVANPSNQEWYLTWLMGLALILPYSHAHALAWRLSAYFLPLVIYTVKSGSLFLDLVSNALLYLLVLVLGCHYFWMTKRLAKHPPTNGNAQSGIAS